MKVSCNYTLKSYGDDMELRGFKSITESCEGWFVRLVTDGTGCGILIEEAFVDCVLETVWGEISGHSSTSSAFKSKLWTSKNNRWLSSSFVSASSIQIICFHLLKHANVCGYLMSGLFPRTEKLTKSPLQINVSLLNVSRYHWSSIDEGLPIEEVFSYV